jgi:ubiquinone/menaquinone biosynthesis C-methylase UbiE
MPDAGWWEALWPNPAGVLTAVGLKVGMDVIDLCSGDGWFTLQIARIAKRVVAVDLDPALIEVARRRLAESNVTNVEFATGDAYDLATLAPRKADFVFLANVFHGVPDQPRLARAVHAAMKPRARFAIVNWHQHPREETTVLGQPRGPKTELRMSPQQTFDAVQGSGLRRADLIEVPPYHYSTVFERPEA